MSRRGAEAKPPWSAVPPAVRADVERILGAGVVRAERVYGGYGPSATFRMCLADGRRAFFKGTYPLAPNSGVRWALDREERVYRELGALLRPWMPAYHGGFRRDGWHVVLLEDVGAANVPPWTIERTRGAARSYADFHRSTLGKRLPRWLPRRRQWGRFGDSWRRFAEEPRAFASAAGLAGTRRREALDWLRRAFPVLRASAESLVRARPPHALIHFDTRSDNVRVTGGLLRLLDWPYACVGPIEFDVAAFAQSVTAEGGPEPERVIAWYGEGLALRDRLLDASTAAIAGYFIRNSWLPAPRGLPRLRSIQRRQLKASLAWAARALDLPEPRWLAAVPD